LYIGNTVVSYSVAIVLNVTRDRIGAVLPDVAAIFRARAAAASRRDIGSSLSYRSTRLDVPSGAISNSRQRITHPLSVLEETSTPVLSFPMTHSRDTLSSRWPLVV
jgi:hypothetical protein